MTVRVVFTQTDHAHQWSNWINIDYYRHYRKCTVDGCNEIEYGAHTISDVEFWESDALYHYHICSDCGGACGTANHIGDGGEICPVCGGRIGYEITLDPGDGICTPTKVYTNTYGYLDIGDLPTPTNGSQPFSGWYTAATGGSRITESYRFTGSDTIYAQWGEAQQYTIIVTADPKEGGKVTASAVQAEAGTTITLTVEPAAGYQLKEITAQDDSGGSVSISKYQLTMPAANVTVTAKFETTGQAFAILGLPQRTIYVDETFQLTTAGGSGSGTVTWNSSDKNVATVDGNGKVTTVGTGNVSITAQRGGEYDQVSFVVSGGIIEAVTILNLNPPVQGETPAQTVLVPEDAHYGSLTQMGIGGSTLDVVWTDSTGTAVTSFEMGIEYTADIMLQAKDNYTFADQVEVTLENLQPSAYSKVFANKAAANRLTVTVTAVPDAGYELAGLAVTDKNGGEISLTGLGEGEFTFQMPGGSVTVEADFAETTPDYAACDRGADCPLWKFGDLDRNAWYHDGVHYYLAAGLMVGTSDAAFAPQETTSRAMIVTVLWRLAGCPAGDETADFTDVAQGTWYTEAVRWAAGQGIVEGYGDGTFGPNDPITREQMAVMLYRYVQNGGGGFTGRWAFPLDYADADQVSDWAYEALCWMTMYGIIQGTGDGSTLSPGAGASRVEAAVMLQRFLTGGALLSG